MRFGQEQCGSDANGNPIYKDFAYCDNCTSKVEIQQAPTVEKPNNDFKSVGIQNINNTPKKKKNGCLWYIIIFFLVCALFSQCGNSNDDSDNAEKNDTSTSSEIATTPKAKNKKKKESKKHNNIAKSKKPKQTVKPKKTASLKQNKAKNKETAKATKTKFKNSCKTYNYKKVMRDPKKYIGKKIKLKCQINQISEDGWFTQGFLRCYSYSGYGIYANNEYVIFDERVSKSPKLLADDIITVYGTIEEPEKMTRALTGTKDTVFTIKMKYVKIHS